MAESKKILHFPILIEQDEDGIYIVSCPSFHGCHSYGKTVDEALANIQEAIEMYREEKPLLKVEEGQVAYLKSGKEAERAKAINHYFGLLTPQQKESVIGLIKSFLKTDERISREQYNSELTAAEKRIAEGKFVSQKDVERLSGKW